VVISYVDLECVFHQPDDRKIRHPAPVGETAALQPPTMFGCQSLVKFDEQPRFPDACLSHEENHLTMTGLSLHKAVAERV
jgi:hypothetical protein